MKKQLLTFLAALSLFAVLAPMGASAQGNSEAAETCQQGGYANWSARESGPPFTSTGECVSAVAQGKVYPAHYPAPTISIVREGTSDVYGQAGTNILYCFYRVTYCNLLVPDSPFVWADPSFYITYFHDGEVESVSSTYLIENGVAVGDIVPFGKTQVIVVTDRQTGEVLATGTPQVCEAPA